MSAIPDQIYEKLFTQQQINVKTVAYILLCQRNDTYENIVMSLFYTNAEIIYAKAHCISSVKYKLIMC